VEHTRAATSRLIATPFASVTVAMKEKVPAAVGTGP
jgi:hypothetical protein